jgi:two-component system chemotaxis response regulator CheY
MKVLIVDDSADVRTLIRVLLEHRGHIVVGEAEDGAAGLKAFTELRPDLVLLDIIMPGMSGLEVLERIKKVDPATKVIMVTAVEQDGINRRLLLLGAAGIIFKPFNEEDFYRALRSARPPGEKAEPMPRAEAESIVNLAAGGLSLCMLRTSEASSWAWELCGTEVRAGRLADVPRLLDFGAASASVQVSVREGLPLTAALVFRAQDIHFISSCWAKGPLYNTASVKELEEGILIEIGNIILNALINPLINAAHQVGLPSVPMLVKGGPGAVAAALGGCLDPAADLRIVRASLAMRREGRVARAAVLALLPQRRN